ERRQRAVGQVAPEAHAGGEAQLARPRLHGPAERVLADAVERHLPGARAHLRQRGQQGGVVLHAVQAAHVQQAPGRPGRPLGGAEKRPAARPGGTPGARAAARASRKPRANSLPTVIAVAARSPSSATARPAADPAPPYPMSSIQTASPPPTLSTTGIRRARPR